MFAYKVLTSLSISADPTELEFILQQGLRQNRKWISTRKPGNADFVQENCPIHIQLWLILLVKQRSPKSCNAFGHSLTESKYTRPSKLPQQEVQEQFHQFPEHVEHLFLYFIFMKKRYWICRQKNSKKVVDFTFLNCVWLFAVILKLLFVLPGFAMEGDSGKKKISRYALCFQERPLSKHSESNWPSQRIQQIKKVVSKINLRWKLLNNFLWKIDYQILHFTRTSQDKSTVMSLHIFRNMILLTMLHEISEVIV